VTPKKAKEPKIKSPRQKRLRTTIKLSLFFVFIAITFVGLGFARKVSAIIHETPVFNLSAFSNLAAPTLIYDRNNRLLTEMKTQDDRELIKNIHQVSPYLAKAFVAAEDKDFYHHFGVNPVAILRAVVQDALPHHAQSGASTITQQTVKLAVFPGQEHTLQRKIQEAVLAIDLEHVLTKDEILTDYMNWIYYGKMGSNNVYGVARASKALFDKSPLELNLAQSAFLAAIPNNPALFSPYYELSNAITRQHYVLDNMLQLGFINRASYDEAMQFNIASSIKKIPETDGNANYGEFPFVNTEVKEKAIGIMVKIGLYKTTDQAEQALSTGGYKIYTTIDTKAQQVTKKVLANDSLFDPPISYSVPDGKGGTVKKAVQEQAGATLIDNATGGILAIGGGRNFTEDQNNHTELWRQPGSSIKPLADYGPAINLHLLSPGSVIDDVPTQWPDNNAPDGKYFPLNWDKSFHGLVSARKALYESYNIPALKVFDMVGPSVGLGYLEKMGITTITPQDKNNLAAGIGGLTKGLTVEQATSAYSTFPNQGVWRDGYLIEKIADRNGDVVYQHQSTMNPVFSPQAAYLMTNMMEDVVKKGTAAYYVGSHYQGLPVAGKTGTTDGNKDAWFIGFTPLVTLGVWGGYDVPYPMTEYQSHHPQVVWDDIINGIQSYGYPVSGKFTEPSGIVPVEISTKSGLLPTPLCKQLGDVTTDLFIQGTEPTTYDNVLVQAKYIVLNGVKYLATESSPPNEVKEGTFIKRAPYTLPNGNTSYLPSDYTEELPKLSDPRKASAPASSKLSPPNGIKITGSSASSVTLEWSSVDGAASYIILRGTSADGPFAPISSDPLTATTYSDSSVVSDKHYFYEVESVSSTGDPSKPSTIVTADPGLQKPAAPTNIQATFAPVGVTLTWDPSAGATQYVVLRGVSANGSLSPNGTADSTSYNDVGALSGATYYYQVIAVNSAGDSASVPVKVTVPAKSSN